MARHWRGWLCLTLATAALFSIIGCDGSGDSSSGYKFVNNSSYTVHVKPNGQNWTAATISPGGEVTIDYDNSTIQYIYDPSDDVVNSDDGKGTTTFTDRPATEYKFINNSSHTVHIKPNGQTWPAATISPGKQVTIEWRGSIQYIYDPSNYVSADNQGGTIIFTNK
jgi:uncharacterized protein YdeI (BOF family)